MARVRNAIVSLMALSTLLMGSCCIRNKKNMIDLTNNANIGIINTEGEVLNPDSNGVLKTYTLKIPNYKAGVYSSPDSYYDNWPPINGNRVLPWAFSPKTIILLFEQPAYGVDDQINSTYKVTAMKNRTRYVSRYGIFLQLQLADGRYMAILPLASNEAVTWLYVDKSGNIELLLCNHGTEPVSGKIPLIAWSIADNVNKACFDLFRQIEQDKKLGQNFKLRYQKEYPEVFKYLGWCTWEEYKKNISEKLLINDIVKIKNSSLPIRYAIIDDGHLTYANQKTEFGDKLSSFKPNNKFPNGFGSLLKLKDPATIKWIGIWQNMNGYWGGFSQENDFGDKMNSSMRILEKTGRYMPKNDSLSIAKVYETFLGKAANDGFDFLKVDWQAANLYLLNKSENAAKQAFLTSHIVDNIAHKYYNNGMINCMAMNNIVLLNTRYVNVERVSIDYKLNNRLMAKEHLLQSYYNTVYMGQCLWGDQDMFHSSDSICGRIMALAKSVSGGPIYLSDAPQNIVADLVWPLCYNDGSLIRPLSPAATLQRSVFSSPINEKELYYISAPLNNNAAAIVAYNLSADSLTIDGTISAEDYAMTGTLLQPYQGKWKIPNEGLYLFDFFAQKGEILSKDHKFSITNFGDKYFIVTPIVNGWAVIGRSDKFLSPATVDNIKYTANSVSFSMKESGPIIIWMKTGKPYSSDIKFSNLGDGLWKGNMKKGIKNFNVLINK